jgi:nucleotide sugar dehydrogenase
MSNISAKALETHCSSVVVHNLSGEPARLAEFVARNSGREVVVVQGIGFVGAAMIAALAKARRNDGTPRFAVVGVDLATESTIGKVDAVLAGKSPIVSPDASLLQAYQDARRNGNVTATTHAAAFRHASVVIVDVNFDVRKLGSSRNFELHHTGFRAALQTVVDNICEDTLVVIETTVPPGTTERVVQPAIREAFERRGLNPRRALVAYSYERVMPGPNYLSSITDYYRVFAGVNEASSVRARAFFASFIDTNRFPLSELQSPTASEMAKVLENSFRAINIALIQEWSEFAQNAGVDLFEVIEAIRMRPTHRNLMAPGFGVGGYCLTKDSLLADWAARNYFKRDGHLTVALDAIDVNDAMPLHTLALIRQLVHNLAGKNILIMGVSYLNDVADTRFSPTDILYEACTTEGAHVLVHDTMVDHWPERGINIDTCREALHRLPPPDVVVFAVRHQMYLTLDGKNILELFPTASAVVDANNVLTDATAVTLAEHGVAVAGVGKGHWRAFNRVTPD